MLHFIVILTKKGIFKKPGIREPIFATNFYLVPTATDGLNKMTFCAISKNAHLSELFNCSGGLIRTNHLRVIAVVF